MPSRLYSCAPLQVFEYSCPGACRAYARNGYRVPCTDFGDGFQTVPRKHTAIHIRQLWVFILNESYVTDDHRLGVFRNIGLQLAQLRHLRVSMPRKSDVTEDHRSGVFLPLGMYSCSFVYCGSPSPWNQMLPKTSLGVFRNIGLQLAQLRHLRVSIPRESDVTEDHRTGVFRNTGM